MSRVATALVAASLAAGCGGGEDAKSTAVHDGAVVYRDALDDNHGGWLLVDDLVFFRGGRYHCAGRPSAGATWTAPAGRSRCPHPGTHARPPCSSATAPSSER